MKKTVNMEKFDDWRVVARNYPALDKIIEENFVDDVHHLQLTFKKRPSIYIAKLEVLGAKYIKWQVNKEWYYIYGIAGENIGHSIESQIVVGKPVVSGPNAPKITRKRTLKVPKQP